MPRPPKAKTAAKDSAENLSFGVCGCKSVGAIRPRRSNPALRRLSIVSPAVRDIEADVGPLAVVGPNTFRRDLHPDLRAA